MSRLSCRPDRRYDDIVAHALVTHTSEILFKGGLKAMGRNSENRSLNRVARLGGYDVRPKRRGYSYD